MRARSALPLRLPLRLPCSLSLSATDKGKREGEGEGDEAYPLARCDMMSSSKGIRV